jgi:hypothetical protein
MNSAGIAGFDATSTGSENGATFSISASTGAAVFKGSIQSGSTITGAAITGSSFQSTNYAAGTGIGITTSSTIDSIKFRSGGVERASFDVVSGGLVISAGSASITMSSLGAISIASASNTLLMANAPYFLNGSGSNSGGAYGSIRNTWVDTVDPSGGDAGDVWLKWV